MRGRHDIHALVGVLTRLVLGVVGGGLVGIAIVVNTDANATHGTLDILIVAIGIVVGVLVTALL